MIRPATPAEIVEWDTLIAANPDGGNPLQLEAFAKTKSLHGWTPRYLIADDVAILVLTRRIAGMGEYWYVPKGPGVVGVESLSKIIKELRQFSTQPFAIRLDPEIKSALNNLPHTTMAPRNIQYNVDTVIVDLSPQSEDILASFKQKTRYNIRLGAKKGVEVMPMSTNETAINEMYRLTQVTTQRAGVYLRPKEYFADFWKLHADSGHGQMFFASLEGQILAGAYITYVGHKALYKDGGSVREHAEVQAPYALQWGIMQWLKQQNITEYDLHGVPPVSQLDNPNHPLAGLARFKIGFNQEVTSYGGTVDIIINPRKYAIWRRIGERAALSYQSRVKKRLFY